MIGEEAKKVFYSCDKTIAIVYYKLPKEQLFNLYEDFMALNQIFNCGELFIVTNDLSWIYFGTHEESMGLVLYFIKKNRV